MPHCIVEYACELNANAVLEAVYSGTERSGLFVPEDIKLRAQPFRDYFSGAGKQSFVHVSARILSGRTLEQRQQLSRSILQSLEALELRNSSLTVEVIEMERQSYAKTVSAP